MPDMTNNDMVDLFKRAASQYPLRTESADWEGVAGKLDEKEHSIAWMTVFSKKELGKRKYLALLILFPLALIGYYGMHIKLSSKPPGITNQISRTEKKPAALNSFSIVGQGSMSTGLNKLINSHSAGAEEFRLSAMQEKGFRNTILPSFAVLQNEIGVKEPFIYLQQRKLTTRIPSMANDPAAPVSNAKNKQSHFYAGLIVAPDISMVKFQSVKGVGFSAGILFGYRINQKFAIESGVYFDTKNYFTQGDYFSTKNVPQMINADLLNVNGTCHMVEFPVNLRYDFHASKKNNWFITGGFSSYFMFKESYNYNYLYNGSPRERSYDYNKPSQNWFSVLDISIGYEHSAGRFGKIRVEPYLKTPLAGMGAGSLPILSTGINLGFIHQFK
jgi:Outer membrane protein beta-barrel domain